MIDFFIQIIEENSTGKQCRHGQHKQGGGEPACHNGDVVESEKEGADDMCKHTGQILLQGQKGKAAEEEFFQPGIDDGYVNGNKEKSSKEKNKNIFLYF